MARHGLSRPAGPVVRRRPPPHDTWRAGLWTGILRLRLEIPPGQYVSPATGRLGLIESGGGEIVAQRAATRGGVPVLPGSGIKGAVRTLYELLSFSCDPLNRTAAERCTSQDCCDACSLFGLPGYSGRISFGDAVPHGAPVANNANGANGANGPNGVGAVRVEVQLVPVPWTPDAAKTPGEFRLYDQSEATFLEAGRKTVRKQPKELARQVYVGTFETRMAFTNLEPEELGRVLLAMGLGTDRKTRFPLRLGGVKYDGKGAVRVVPHELQARYPRPRAAVGEVACGEEYVRWIAAARASEWAGAFWPLLEEIAAVLRAPA